MVTPATAARAVLAGLLEPLDTPLARETMPAWLLPHQADAVARARGILERFGGVLIADGVGLGKTYVALALAALERRSGGEAVAVVPAALRGEWTRASAATAVAIPVFTHAALAVRRFPQASQATLVLVDEAHSFRNPRTRRYDALARLTAGRRVALLSATPLNNSVRDLAALIHLFAGWDRFREFGVPDLLQLLASGHHGGASLALGALSVCRTRRLVERRFPELRTAFPERVLLPPVRYDLDAVCGGRLRSILAALISLGGAHTRAERGGALLHLNLLRRLESSRAAFRRSLLRHRNFLAEWDGAREKGVPLSRAAFRAAFPHTDDDSAQLVLWPLLRSGDAPNWDGDLDAWCRAIDGALALIDGLPADQDAKCDALESLLEGELAGRKTIVFTEFRDTALHLFRRLRSRGRVLAVLGDAAWAGAARVTRGEALDAFAPGSRGTPADPLLQADLLIATDVASEGMNLQDACSVVNYDLPWNPVRVMQRVGRVDRLHSPHRQVHVAHLVPTNGLHDLTGVLRVLRTKLAHTAAVGAEPDPMGAMWWIDRGTPLPEAIERESWRRVEPFEARERWRALIGTPPPGTGRLPRVAAGVVEDGEAPAVGVLLALEWPGGRRIPLAFVLTAAGELRSDASALGALAERALGARTVPAGAGEFASALASTLPLAREQLLACSAARHGTHRVGPGRRAALEALSRSARDAERRRDISMAADIEQAIGALASELPAGLDRLLAERVAMAGQQRELASMIGELLRQASPPAGPPLDGSPRLVLVAALAIATRCPAD